MKKLSLFLLILFTSTIGWGQIVWSGAGLCTTGAGTAWLTAGSWCSGAIPTSAQIAQFGNGATFGSATVMGINMAGATNNGVQNQVVGAIEIANSRTSVLSIGNSSGTKTGTLTLNGVTVNATANVIIRNNSAQLLTIQAIQGANLAMSVALANVTNNIINIDGTGGITISSIIGGANQLTLAGSGTGVLTLSGANTYSGGTTITAGNLTLGAANTLPSAGNIILGGGTLTSGSGAGFSQAGLGTLGLTNNSTIGLGTGSHAINFAASNAIAWTAGKMITITGWKGGFNGTSGTGGQIFVGASAAGLTAGQLAQIQFFNGATNIPATILPTGEVIPAILPAVPSAYIVDEGFTTGPASLNPGFTTLTAGGIYSAGGNFGRNSTSLQFNATGQILQYGPWSGSADQVSFLYLSIGGAGSSFAVEESTNGIAWTTVTNSPATTITTAATFTAPLLATSLYLKITYTNTGGSTMFDDLRIRKAGSFAGTNHINILEELINGGCGTCEAYNEFVYFETGDSTLDVKYLELVNPTMSYGPGDLAMGGNGTVSSGYGGNNNTNVNWILNASLTGTQTAYTSGLNTTAGCAMFVDIPASNIIPEYAKVIAFTGCCPDANYDFSAMCPSLASNGQAYVIYASENSGCGGSGKYGNSCGANCTRFLTLFNHKTGDNSNKSFTAPATTANGDSWDFVAGAKVVTGCKFVVLSANVIEFKATAIDATTSKIKFTTANENNIKQYIITKSYDGFNYSTVDHQMSLNRQEKTNYFSQDKINSESNSVIYYRLEEEDFNGVKKIVANCILSLKPSKEIIVSYNESGILVSMPVQAKSIELLSLDGKNISYLEGNENDLLFQINLESVAKGFYLLRITDANEKVTVKKIIH